MRPDQIERRLAAMPVVLPQPGHERRLLAALHDAERAAQTQRHLQRLSWWRRPIPLWQAAAAIAALILIDIAWLRPESPAPPAESLFAVRIDRDLFGRRERAGEPLDVSRWETRINATQ